MKITFDRDANAWYICLKKINPGEVSKTTVVNYNFNISLDKCGGVISIGLLG